MKPVMKCRVMLERLFQGDLWCLRICLHEDRRRQVLRFMLHFLSYCAVVKFCEVDMIYLLVSDVKCVLHRTAGRGEAEC